MKWGVYEPGVFVVGNELHLDRRRVIAVWFKMKGQESNIILADIFGLVR